MWYWPIIAYFSIAVAVWIPLARLYYRDQLKTYPTVVGPGKPCDVAAKGFSAATATVVAVFWIFVAITFSAEKILGPIVMRVWNVIDRLVFGNPSRPGV